MKRVVDPYLHEEAGFVYSPLTDLSVRAGEPGYEELRSLMDGRMSLAALSADLNEELAEKGWLVEADSGLAQRFRLKYVSLEGDSDCNQACSFCPVSVAPREHHSMSLEFYEDIVRQLAPFKSTLQAVFMHHYNEPTLDKRFVDQARILKKYGLPEAVNTNASGLTPARVDALLEMGGILYLSVNLSTLDRQRYAQDRGRDHLEVVMRNLDYIKHRPLAKRMELAVLGNDDERHRRDFREIVQYFSGSRFRVRSFVSNDRSGYLYSGARPGQPHQRLCGCEQMGSRPLQHLHIDAHGSCVLCCQDYSKQQVVGDLTQQTVGEVLTGPAMALMRRWIYGIEEAPQDFICRHCVFARKK